MIFLLHTNTVILLEPYCGTITEPGLPVEGLRGNGHVETQAADHADCRLQTVQTVQTVPD